MISVWLAPLSRYPSAPAHRGEHGAVVLAHGEHDHPGVRAVRSDLPGGGDPVQLGHLHIHHHDVGLQFHGQCHGLPSVRGRADHLDAGDGRQ